MAKIFFKGLNELRAIAALAVVIGHIEMFKFQESKSSLFNTFLEYFISHIGKNAVYLFFVLSGFLITYLLLQEKVNNNTISLMKFYLRRVFRIWPLYYLILLISFWFIPFLANHFEIFKETPFYFDRIMNADNYSPTSLGYYLFFLPNVALYLGHNVVGCAQTWSVGIEEQFYILWPILLLFIQKKILPFVFLGIIVFMPVFTFFVAPIFSFEFMSIGALGAYALFYFPDIVKSFFKKYKYMYQGLIVLIFVLMCFRFTYTYIQNVALSILFICLILNTVLDNSGAIFSSKRFSFLGKISYGIYMYHPFIMFLVFPIANRYIGNPILYNVFLYVMIIGLSIVTSHLSYKYFELKFIKIKDTKFKTL